MSVPLEFPTAHTHGVAAYYSELEHAMQYIRDTPDLSIDEKRKFFKRANINFGKIHNAPTLTSKWHYCIIDTCKLGISALCLSGGASFGYCRRLSNEQ